MGSELSKALKLVKDKVKNSDLEDFELILDVTDMNFVWVNEKAASNLGRTVAELIGENFFEITGMPAEELKAIINELVKTGGRFTIPFQTMVGTKNMEMQVKPIYIAKDRPFLVGNIIEKK